MAKVLGLGGIFFKSKDPKALMRWYSEHLGLPGEDYVAFEPSAMPPGGSTVFSAFKDDTDYFAPSSQPFMFNLVVDDLDGALKQVQAGGAELLGAREDYDYGSFGRFLDPDGNKVELWQPKS
ncbi:VOC family protein [Massilia endophytica]|uniref:VOC family protein n=1 Tax=Massilia endophytica TaxID=2899220 RepID=UPI001E603EE3|nr:VOC family protein [Massilia endophytica]UGQ45886.1 VOC family protein [Massilia endophytica]